MTTNTNSAQERTASIDLAQLDKLGAEAADALKTYSYILAEPDVQLALISLARRSLTSGAPADDKPVAWMDPTAGCVMDAFLWQHDAANPQYSVPVYAPVHDAAAPSAERKYTQDDMERYALHVRDAALERLAGAAAKTEQEECRMCNSSGIVGFPPDQYEECPDCIVARESSAAAKTEQVRECEYPHESAECLGCGWKASAAGVGSAQADTKGAALDERALFEAYMGQRWSSTDFGQCPDCTYSGCVIQDAWVIWQARAAVAPSRDAGQEEASTQMVPSIGDDLHFSDLITELHAAHEEIDPEHSKKTWATLVAYIDGRTVGTAGAWQPIETAPKDGSTMLLGCFNTLWRWRTMRGQWFSEAAIAEDWEDPDDAEEGWYETAVEPDVPNCWSIAPTHWMPLPAAPSIATKETL